MKRIKQVILIRKDLNMRRGKEIAQGAHASMEFLITQLRDLETISPSNSVVLSTEERQWIQGAMAKICLRVESEQALLQYHQSALQHGLKSFLICDSGKTEFSGVSTYTACAIGPDDAQRIDQVTGQLIPY